PLLWWKQAMNASVLLWDLAEHYEKMSFRNRYSIATAHGKHSLSIPLHKGREQRAAMKDIKLSYNENWQKQHWRTLFSAYNRSPYFEYYSPELETIFLKKQERLVDFNMATVHWVKRQLRLNTEEKFITEYRKNHEVVTDLRNLKPQDESAHSPITYHQVFEDRNGFIPHLSILDLLFNEGKYAIQYLKDG